MSNAEERVKINQPIFLCFGIMASAVTSATTLEREREEEVEAFVGEFICVYICAVWYILLSSCFKQRGTRHIKAWRIEDDVGAR